MPALFSLASSNSHPFSPSVSLLALSNCIYYFMFSFCKLPLLPLWLHGTKTTLYRYVECVPRTHEPTPRSPPLIDYASSASSSPFRPGRSHVDFHCVTAKQYKKKQERREIHDFYPKSLKARALFVCCHVCVWRVCVCGLVCSHVSSVCVCAASESPSNQNLLCKFVKWNCINIRNQYLPARTIKR